MRKLSLISAILLFLLGLLWVGQGLGIIHWPASSFMIEQIQWSYYGAGLILLSVIIIIASRR